MAGVYIEGLDFPKESDGTYKQFRAGSRKLPKAYVFSIFVGEDGSLEVHPWDEAEMQVKQGTTFAAKFIKGCGDLIDKDEAIKDICRDTFPNFSLAIERIKGVPAAIKASEVDEDNQ